MISCFALVIHPLSPFSPPLEREKTGIIISGDSSKVSRIWYSCDHTHVGTKMDFKDLKKRIYTKKKLKRRMERLNIKLFQMVGLSQNENQLRDDYRVRTRRNLTDSTPKEEVSRVCKVNLFTITLSERCPLLLTIDKRTKAFPLPFRIKKVASQR